MLYYAKEIVDRTLVDPVHIYASTVVAGMRMVQEGLSMMPYGEAFAPHMRGATHEFIAEMTRRFNRPDWKLAANEATGQITQRVIDIPGLHPICRLVEFSPAREQGDPVLMVAPMSGHWATLVRPSVQRMLDAGRRVYVTDWNNARDLNPQVRFDLDDYADVLVKILRFLNGEAHAIAVCQPSVPLIMAVSLLEADGDPSVPKSMILKGGPIDTRRSPTAVNDLAQRRGLGWFEENVIWTVPPPYEGFSRPVYPHFLQIFGFMAMNMKRHVVAHSNQYMNLVRGDLESAAAHREFYDEYLSAQDLVAEYFLQTVDNVFIRHQLPRGEMRYRDAVAVCPAAITRVPVMAVEGTLDDITGVGQCAAILELCSRLPDRSKDYHLQEGAGHYAIFSGRRYREEIAPRELAFMDRVGRRKMSRGARFPVAAPAGLLETAIPRLC